MAMKALYVIWDVLKMMGSGVVNLFDLVMEAKKLQQEMEARRINGIYRLGSKTW